MRMISGLVPLLALGGCISLLPAPAAAPRLFILEAAAPEASNPAPVNAVLAIAAPQGERAYLGTELAWRSNDELSFIAGVAWAGRAQDLLQTMLVETVARAGRLRGAARVGETRADYELRCEVLDFEAVAEADAAKARFVVLAKLIDAHTRELVATRFIEVEEPLAESSQTSAADALTRAAREGGARIAAFAADEVEKAQASAVSISK